MYGESANIRALKKALDFEGVTYKIDCKSLYDEINIMSYDFIYIGTGLDESYPLVLEDLKRYKDDLNKYIDAKKFILVTGNDIPYSVMNGTIITYFFKACFILL